MLRLHATPADLATAAALLRAGRLVAFPTETVYGLGADALDPKAVARIFAAKGRPADHPLIVHLRDAQQLAQFARHVPERAQRLAQAFWPGPLTIVLERSDRVPDAVTGGQSTVGLRVPSHPVALALLAAFGGGLAAPSANRFGRISPTRAEHVVSEFGDTDAVAALVDGGPCQVGIESTIVDLSGARPRVLRPGGIEVARIEAVLGEPLDGDLVGAPRASGTLASHYAPDTPVAVVPAADLVALVREAAVLRPVVALVRTVPARDLPAHAITMPLDPLGYAHELYAALRSADASGAALIVVEAPPAEPAWLAVADRLRRAATR
jgi:L-threonylcarbamoyladenylate synthase